MSLMIEIEAVNLYGRSPVSIRMMAIEAAALYLILAAIAWWLDRWREPA